MEIYRSITELIEKRTNPYFQHSWEACKIPCGSLACFKERWPDAYNKLNWQNWFVIQKRRTASIKNGACDSQPLHSEDARVPYVR